MLAFLQVIGILSLLSAISVLIIGLVRHFFPSVDELIPDSFKKALKKLYGIAETLVNKGM